MNKKKRAHQVHARTEDTSDSSLDVPMGKANKNFPHGITLSDTGAQSASATARTTKNVTEAILCLGINLSIPIEGEGGRGIQGIPPKDLEDLPDLRKHSKSLKPNVPAIKKPQKVDRLDPIKDRNRPRDPFRWNQIHRHHDRIPLHTFYLFRVLGVARSKTKTRKGTEKNLIPHGNRHGRRQSAQSRQSRQSRRSGRSGRSHQQGRQGRGQSRQSRHTKRSRSKSPSRSPLRSLDSEEGEKERERKKIEPTFPLPPPPPPFQPPPQTITAIQQPLTFQVNEAVNLVVDFVATGVAKLLVREITQRDIGEIPGMFLRMFGF